MFSIISNNIDIGKIADSAQCFRMNYIGKGKYSVIAFNKYVEIAQIGDRLIFSCDEAEFNDIWRNYLDFDTDYNVINQKAKVDNFLSKAIEYSNGIKILKQDLWETLITYIISQRKNIPAIKKCVETLSTKFGDKIKGSYISEDEKIHHYSFYSFPSPEKLSSIDLKELEDCGLGYRDTYIINAAKWFLQNITIINGEYVYAGNADILNSYTKAKSVLMQINGVGNKVANCVCLFALHQYKASTIDLYMQQIIDTLYQGIMPEWMVSEYSGIYQQYAFYYQRNHTI